MELARILFLTTRPVSIVVRPMGTDRPEVRRDAVVLPGDRHVCPFISLRDVSSPGMELTFHRSAKQARRISDEPNNLTFGISNAHSMIYIALTRLSSIT